MAKVHALNRSRGDVGIWHETCRVVDGQYECVYSGMPAYGLGKASNLVPVSNARESARARLKPTGQETAAAD